MLADDAIYIWRIRFDVTDPQPDARLEDWRRLLSIEERRRADAFRGPGLRRDYLLTHAVLRTVLGWRLGVAPAEVQFAAGSFAGAGSRKPAIAAGEGGEASGLRFNLSHTQGAALIAISVGRELGVDIERQRPMEDLAAIARAVMSAGELKQWQELTAEEQTPAFYRVWTRKEAYLKAIGLGLFRDPPAVTVPVLPVFLNETGGWRVADSAGDGEWRVADVEVAEGYSASVCCEGESLPPVTIADLAVDEIGAGQAGQHPRFG